MSENPILARAALPDKIYSALDESQTRIVQDRSALEKDASKVDKMTAATTKAISAGMDAAVAAQTIKDTLELERQNTNLAALEAAGGTQARIKLMEDINTSNVNMTAALDEYHDKKDDEVTGIGIVDGVLNLFRSIPAVNEYNKANLERKRSIEHLQDITWATDAVVSTTNKTAKTINDGYIAANSQALAAGYKEKAAMLEVQNAQSNAAARVQLMNADSRAVSNLMEQWKLEGAVQEREMQDKRYELTRMQFEQEREAFPLRMQQLKSSVERSIAENEDYATLRPDAILARQAQARTVTKEYNDALLVEEQYTTNVQAAEMILGLPTVSSREVIKDGMRQGGEIGKAYWTKVMIGATGKLGNNPYESMSNWKSLDPTNTAPRTFPTALLERFQTRLAEKYSAAGEPLPRDEAALAAAFNAEAKADLEVSAKNIMPNTGNPFEAPPMTALARDLENKRIPLYDKVIKLKGMTDTVPQAIIDEAAIAVKAKIITPEQAAQGIVDIFRTAAAVNNTQDGGFSRLGLPHQTSYNTSINRAASFLESAKTIGLTKGLDPLLGLGSIAPGVKAGIQAAVPSLDSDAKIRQILTTRSKVLNLMDYNEAQEAVIQSLNAIGAKQQ